MESTPVSTQLRNLFPTIGKRSFGGKSSESKSSKGKRPPSKKTKKDIVHKDVVLLPSLLLTRNQFPRTRHDVDWKTTVLLFMHFQ